MKYKYYIIITAALLLVATVLYLKEKPGTLKQDIKAFAVSDTSAITTITFGDGKKTLTLERNGSIWLVNRKFHARPRAVKSLLTLLMNLEISSPVSSGMKQEVLKSFKENGISVSVGSSEKTMRSFLITDDDSLRIGTFMMLKDDSEPYMVHLTGFDGRISLLFPCDPQFWRDRTIFAYKPSDILAVEIRYGDKSRKSFAYRFQVPDGLEITSLNDKKSIRIKKDIARSYLSNFAAVAYERQVSKGGKEIMDSLKLQKPFCEIRVQTVYKQENVVRTYQMPVQGEKGKFDLNRMYAVLQNDTFPVIVKYIDLDPIMKEYGDFVTP